MLKEDGERKQGNQKEKLTELLHLRVEMTRKWNNFISLT